MIPLTFQRCREILFVRDTSLVMTKNVVSSSLFTLPKHLISLRQVSTTFFKLNLGERYAITLLRDNYSNDILNSSSLAVNDNCWGRNSDGGVVRGTALHVSRV